MPKPADLRAAAFLALLVVAPCGASHGEEAVPPADKVILFNSSDPAMNAAIEKARDTLPGFWQLFATPAAGMSDFALKLGISDGKMVEHFWCTNIEGNAARSSCAIDNEPQGVFTVKKGQRVDVDPAIISDWLYWKNGKIVGGQTIRVMVTRMEPEEADQTRAMLSDE